MKHSKSRLSGRFTATDTSTEMEERSQVNSLILHLKELEKEQTKSKVSRRRGKN